MTEKRLLDLRPFLLREPYEVILRLDYIYFILLYFTLSASCVSEMSVSGFEPAISGFRYSRGLSYPSRRDDIDFVVMANMGNSTKNRILQRV